MNEYDSILKEKKTYVNSEFQQDKKFKKFPKFKVSLVLIILILVISYVIYYRTVLAAEQVFLTDVSNLISRYQEIFKPMRLEKLGSNYQLEGTILLDEQEYNYGVILDQEKMKFDLASQDQYLFYYLEQDVRYIQMSSFMDNYVQLNHQGYVQMIRHLKNNFLNQVSQDQYIKKFYLDGSIPVVEVNLVLEDQDVQKVIDSSFLKSSYEVLFTFKNHAVTNEILSMKMAITDLKSNQRMVITYLDGELVYSDDQGYQWKFILSTKQEDFTLKIYREEVLYSVLSGTKKEESYQYMYQVIDQVYNLTLDIEKEEDDYLYVFTSSVEKNGIMEKKNAKVTLRYRDEVILEEDTSHAVFYDTLTEEDKLRYQIELENMIGTLRKFIYEYQ